MYFSPRPLPEEVQRLCNELDAPPRLIAHLTLVHDVAVELVQGLRTKFPELEFDYEAVFFGAASHDIGKVLHRNELTGPGNQHEEDGPTLLKEHGVEPEWTRFARTHGRWSREPLPLEDILVALCDCVWKGERPDGLEKQLVQQIADHIRAEQWEVFGQLDVLLEEIARKAEVRLAWQGCKF